jgi:hypothetical protein
MGAWRGPRLFAAVPETGHNELAFRAPVARRYRISIHGNRDHMSVIRSLAQIEADYLRVLLRERFPDSAVELLPEGESSSRP